MTKTEQNRVLGWRLKVLREASAAPRNVAQTCRKSCQRKFLIPARLSAFSMENKCWSGSQVHGCVEATP